jgi:hypothetical protein
MRLIVAKFPNPRRNVMALSLRRISSLALAGVTAALLLGTALPAAAQSGPIVDSARAKEILARYNEATQAAQICESRSLNMPQQTQIAEMAARASRSEYLTGTMLSTVEDSRGWMRMVISSMGCKDPVVMDRLAFFDQQIAPNLR